MSDITPHKPEADEAPRNEAYGYDAGRPDTTPKIGEWYWVLDICEWEGRWHETEMVNNRLVTRKKKKGEKVEWLACVMQVGSNFVELHAPEHKRSTTTTRIHLNDVEKQLRFEPNADEYIAKQISEAQQQVKLLLGEVTEVTRRLGVVPHTEIANQASSGENALAVISSQVDTDAYKNALVQAKNVDLPELFEMVETANHSLARWMTAPTMPTRALMGPMKDDIKVIEDRIYTIEIYAGLTEEAVKIADGDPAMTHEPLRVMQRRLYMDEECLLDYDAGGIDIRNVEDFDAWLSRPHNRDRILPFNRTLVAFRVRRDGKEREDGGNMIQAFVNANIKEADKKTFVYVRNGEQIWRVDCDFVFDEMIIPNREDFDPTGPMMVKYYGNRADEMMPLARWEAYRDSYEKHKEWMKEWEGKPKSPGRSYWTGDSPFYDEFPSSFRPGEWRPFDDSNVYLDEADEALQAEMKRYNRVAVIIQGLFDRSMVLQPHPPVHVWDADSFARSIELVHDGKTLTHGDKPDFEAYRARLNASIDENSIVTGQEEFWMRLEAARENERQRNDYRDNHRRSNYVRYRPYGNPGPGLVSPISEWKPRARKAVFRWEMESQDWRKWDKTMKPKVVTVPSGQLLNVSAYTPGDYKQFYQDPRTRAEYLQWAPLLLAAEDYHAGKIKLGDPGSRANDWER